MMERRRRPRKGPGILIWLISHRVLRWAQRRPRDAGQVAAGTLAALLLITVWIGCSPTAAPSNATAPPPSTPVMRPPAPPRDPVLDLPRVGEIIGEPAVRVRIGKGVSRVRLGGPGPLVIAPGTSDKAQAVARSMTGDITVTRQSDGMFRLAAAGQKTLGWAAPVLVIETRGGHMEVDGVTYPGRVFLHARQRTRTALDVVSHVDIEDYLPGVLERELYPGWHAQAYQAQAVAARSYAIAQSAGARQRGWHYDVESTTASQVYGGQSTRPVARSAVAQTRGIVLTYQGRVVPGYYSSTVGPRGQDAPIAFPRGENMQPLIGVAQVNADTKSPHYRWGPVRRPTAQLSRRIAAWGRANGHPVAALRGLGSIRVTARNTAGRPAQFTVTDAAGTTYTLGPEQLRFACNYSPPGLPAITGAQRIKSSDLTATVSAAAVSFQGYGFGHGVGMSQWGAQQLATQGVSYSSILGRYYPGATLRRAY